MGVEVCLPINWLVDDLEAWNGFVFAANTNTILHRDAREMVPTVHDDLP